MALEDDLRSWVKDTFRLQWDVETTTAVPDAEDLRLNTNHAKDLEEAVVLYADLDGSTDMVDNYKWWFSAEIYKTFLKCSADIIKSEGGTITAYDGDRVMAVYTGDSKNTSAARTALKINYCVSQIIQPALEEQYSTTDFVLKHVVGIDRSQLRAARIGVRGDNDIVWVGRAANYAAKLTNLPGKPTRITEAVYNRLSNDLKETDGRNMWIREYWKEKDMNIYTSTWRWGSC
ncbi:adenylate/guanylate cyclase domain-containing protein [Paraburkholderia phenoliruptrix]|uniref:adenylate/guanylate cyclase domain-containing protein n=1 Tax=Paraburkholderia phenoliruptrix TaxID=252970 RepID=UPI0028699DEF|nr:adenylate/guanylate cyclase domain-containing protein [Paraburkholderia phenoliruptrix]WMY09625.1 adenylate/guanylate cyclase domain-containing protein [Paraburkholderia phenoliruptrix]